MPINMSNTEPTPVSDNGFGQIQLRVATKIVVRSTPHTHCSFHEIAQLRAVIIVENIYPNSMTKNEMR